MRECLDFEALGCVNLREVGGYTTRNGDVLAAGRVFRSAELPIQADSLERLVAHTTLRRVVDLRIDEEVEAAGTLDLPQGCEWLRLPLFEIILPHWSAPTDRTPAGTAQRYFEMVQVGRPAIVRLMELLGDASVKPTLIHCVAGRDRTGIVVACLLDLIDVPDETIAADYGLSSVVDDAAGRNADPENILLLLELIRDHYGSVQNMLLGSGASPHIADRLRTALVA
jgi:protein-tyrosine phosphatase